MKNIADIRKDYSKEALDESHTHANPYTQFDRWWHEALSSEIDEVNAMALATVGADGRPSARIVLLKGFNNDGFVFFTNYHSRKGKQMEENPFASLVFFWKELERQVRISGQIEKISDAENDEYFFSRPPESQVGAWSSPQSTVIPSRAVLDANVKHYTDRFSQSPMTRPAHWGGYRLKPDEIEFWQGRPSRLHDRIRYRLEEGAWVRERLAP